MANTTESIGVVREDVRGINLEQNFQIAICSLLIYDTLLTMDKEIKYFWSTSWFRFKFTHIIYFTNRYMGIISAVVPLTYDNLNATTTPCNTLRLTSTWIKNIGFILTVVVIDYILAVRVIALWENNRIVSIILKITIACEAVGKATLFFKAMSMTHISVNRLSETIVICNTEYIHFDLVNNMGMIDWLFPAIIGLILVTLALVKSFVHWELSEIRSFKLVNVILRDQILYFLLMVYCSIMNILSFKRALTGEAVTIFDAFVVIFGSPSFLCVLGSRAFFNLKEAAEVDITSKGNHLPTIQVGAGTISEPHFASPGGTSSNSI